MELQISSIEYCILDINLQRYTCAGINFMRIVCKKYRQIIKLKFTLRDMFHHIKKKICTGLCIYIYNRMFLMTLLCEHCLFGTNF